MRVFLVLITIVLSLSLQAQDIVFADAGVKALCVASWDSNEDGELSEEEAAAVTTLGTVFRGRTDIGSFPELRYFTSLTTIDDYAFSGSSIGPEIIIPGNIFSIGNYAFYSCQQLKKVIIEEGVSTIGYCAFSGPVSLLSLPASLTYMDSSVINPYINGDPGSGMFVPVGDLTVLTYSPVPPTIHNFAFYYVFGTSHLVVPQGCMAAYKTAGGWSHFGEYLEVGDVNGDGKLNVADVATLIAYVTGQEPKRFIAAAADINGDGVIDANDITRLAHSLLGGDEE